MKPEQQSNMETQLWKIADELRGHMDSSEFKNYMLGFIFFKYLSDKIEETANKVLSDENIDLKFADLDSSIEEIDPKLSFELLEEEVKDINQYYIRPEDLFSNFIKKIKTDETIIEKLSEALINVVSSTIGETSEDDFHGLFDDLDLNNSKLGASGIERNQMISKVMLHIDEIEGLTTDVDMLGNAYEYLIKQFASTSGKKGGEFYTPREISELIARLVSCEKSVVKTIYDPSCGSGSLLIRSAKHFTRVAKICGQELNVTTYNLARMNMFLHGISTHSFDIKQGNTLTNDKFRNVEGFDIIVANPPFGVNWDATPDLLDNDERFSKYGKLAPKSKGEFAFLQHMVHHLKDDGVMASVAPHGVLFRGAAELAIRKYMIEQENVIDAVIGLPANLFYGTGIPACIIVFKKCRTTDDILFIDASKEFEKVKTQNVLKEEHLQKIVKTYMTREDIDKYSRKVSIEEVRENDFNLNIPRYVDTFEEEEPIDIVEVKKNITELELQIEQKKKEIEEMIKEMGLE